jgi:putative Mn2+ efflux pump MntP
MDLFELFVIAVGLSMDAFAVAVCKGLSVYKLKKKHMLLTGLWFGGFQGMMPLIGYLLGSTFEKYITPIDHWVTFVLLGIIGINMIKESFEKDEDGDCCSDTDGSFSVKTMFVMAVATSIDALAVGVSFAFLSVDLWVSVALIGITTFILSAIGLKIGNIFGNKYKSKAEFTGGIVLVLMGIKILVEHTCF